VTLILFAALLFAPAPRHQAKPITRAQAAAPITRAQAAVLRDLYSTDLARRFRAQRRLAASRAMLANPAVGRLLAKVLNADTRRFRAAFAGRTPPLSEGWAEVDSELIDLVLHAYGLRDPAILKAIALAGYDPRSRLARIIAGQGARALPALRRLLADPLDPMRAQAIGVLGFMLQRQRQGRIRHPLTAAQEKWARGRLRAAARDRAITVRSTAVWALGLVGTPADIAVLRRIAGSDPACHPHRSYDVCSQAQQAIAAIEKRAAHARPRARPPSHRR
jgi:HEAT repeat protein